MPMRPRANNNGRLLLPHATTDQDHVRVNQVYSLLERIGVEVLVPVYCKCSLALCLSFQFSQAINLFKSCTMSAPAATICRLKVPSYLLPSNLFHHVRNQF